MSNKKIGPTVEQVYFGKADDLMRIVADDHEGPITLEYMEKIFADLVSRGLLEKRQRPDGQWGYVITAKGKQFLGELKSEE